MSDFTDRLKAARRLFLLETLVEAGGSANDIILRDACRAGFHAHGMTRTVIRDDIGWLEPRGCVRITWIRNDELILAAITERGLDVTRGDVQIAGIQPPSMAR